MLKKRADGRFQKKVPLENGKYKYIYANSKKELQTKIDDINIKLGKGIDLTAERDTFEFWKEKWLKIKEREVSVSRIGTIKYNIKHLKPLYHLQISKIKTIDIQEIIYDLDLAFDTLKQIKSICRGIFQLALENRVIDYNPALPVKIPNDTKKETDRRALSDAERKWIEDTPHPAQLPAMIMLYAGLRRGEVLALMWNDVDLKNKTITVRQSIEFIGDNPNLKSGAKTAAGERIIYIPQILVDYLNSVERTGFFVCTNKKGDLMKKGQWRRMWNSYLTELNLKYGNFSNIVGFEDRYMITQKNGEKRMPSKFAPKKLPMVIPHITPHWLRHTFITIMYMSGVDMLTAQQQAGHADISTTMQIYTHLDSVYKKKQINKMDEFLESV